MRKLLLSFIVSLCATTSVLAQVYPSRPIRVIAPFGAGGGGDTTIRLMAQHLSAAMGQPVVVENRPGVNGVIGTQEVQRSPADGYTLLYGGNTVYAANSSLMKKLPYDPVKDFASVTRVGMMPFVLVVNPATPFQNLKDFIGYARDNPGKLNFASSSASGHVAGAMLSRMAGVKLVHVPYKASSNGMMDVLSGVVPAMIVDLLPALPHIQSGKLRALGVTTPTRAVLMPSVPTMAEAGGLPGYELMGWMAMAAPAGTRPDIVARLNTEVTKILAKPDIKEAFLKAGVEVSTSSPEGMTSFVIAERDKWAAMVKEAGITPE